MRCLPAHFAQLVVLSSAFALLVAVDASTCSAQLVPGTGQPVRKGGDTFDRTDWAWSPNWPKNSYENDGAFRYPQGESKNGRWFEGPKRGQPDMVKRVATPAGGLKNSKGSLLMRTLNSGIPGHRSFTMQQDDLIFSLPSGIDVRRMPSVIVRVYFPPFEQWENRNGPTFAFRTSVEPRNGRTRRVQGKNGQWEDEEPTYWPGIFVDFQSKDNGAKYDHAFLRIRADENGHEYNAVTVKKPGWWTMGMSFTPDGRVHYYAKPGVDKLTQKDHLGTETPYGDPAGEMTTYFFDVCNQDSGRSWSTAWIIDNPQAYTAR